MNKKHIYFIYQLYYMSKEFKELGDLKTSQRLMQLYLENKNLLPKQKYSR